jgi:class 3 adenylate cyclase
MMTAGSLVSSTTEVRYATTDDGAALAYRTIGEGVDARRDVVLVTGGTTPMDALYDDPTTVRLLEGLAGMGRLLLFDRSGVGLSDPPTDRTVPPFARWRSDLEAVMAAAEIRRPVLVSMSLSALAALLYCGNDTDGVAAMVMVEPYPTAGLDPALIRAQLDGEIDSVSFFCPTRADEPGFREWLTQAGQRGASPGLAERAHPTPDADETLDIRRAAARIGVPTLVLRRPAHPLSPAPDQDEIVALVPGALRVDIPGTDLFIFGDEVDALLAETTGFITGTQQLPTPERGLATVLFSDLVGSTDRSSTLGDPMWRRVLDHHDELGRTIISRRGGTVMKTTGDGMLALLPSATSAVQAAQELRSALRVAGLDVRIGIHIGEVEHRSDDVSGIAVVIAARIMALAGADEVFVSHVVPAVLTGSHTRFSDRGRHHLKGVPGVWQVLALDA